MIPTIDPFAAFGGGDGGVYYDPYGANSAFGYPNDLYAQGQGVFAQAPMAPLVLQDPSTGQIYHVTTDPNTGGSIVTPMTPGMTPQAPAPQAPAPMAPGMAGATTAGLSRQRGGGGGGGFGGGGGAGGGGGGGTGFGLGTVGFGTFGGSGAGGEGSFGTFKVR